MLYYIDKNGRAYSRKKGHAWNFTEKGQKRQNFWKFRQKQLKLENILENVSLMRATITRMKQLEYVLNGYHFIKEYLG